ncbi:inclusion body family protein [Streptomyces lancefieldiae]|uniref:Inclusion body family protein n=1 Tax=Streptomyces lancefieldiae TaxID=3075520 RepID=A0ABU3AG09_9ACTN|nr:inclusion body family protein [Streptomyces sp. DSM 40712]MDT0609114.1 inclusion body family protein [Streptomyces sp. DSM 40712]
MADLNVLIAFDAATIVEQNPNASRNPDVPTYVDQNLIYMTTRHDHIVGTSGAELNLRAEPGDTIRWRETTLSLGSDYKALLYRYVSNDRDHTLIRTPEIEVVDGVYPLPKEGSEGSPDFMTQKYEDHYWRTTVKSVGQVVYHFYFQILDRHRQLKGYYQWDPFITIEDS